MGFLGLVKEIMTKIASRKISSQPARLRNGCFQTGRERHGELDALNFFGTL